MTPESATSDLKVTLTPNGSIQRMDYRDIVLTLFIGNEQEGGLTNLYLRQRGVESEAMALIGPKAPCDPLKSTGGRWAGGNDRLRYALTLEQAPGAPLWRFEVKVTNHGDQPVELDLLLTQDLALAPYGAIRLNEYYVSQYLDYTPLDHEQLGTVVAVRQNQAMGGRNPWCLIGSLNRAVAFGTDALQFYGRAARGGKPASALAEGLPGARLQHEHALVSLQDAPFQLNPGESASRGFWGLLQEHHPLASGPSDLVWVDEALKRLEQPLVPLAPETPRIPSKSLFVKAPLLMAAAATQSDLEAWFGPERRHPETQEGALVSFFTGPRTHVVLKQKEWLVLRPHGHLLRTGGLFEPDEAVMTSTVWMDGVFHSMVTQGHVSINRFLSTTHSYLSLFRSHGQRLFLDTGAGWTLLGVPSAFAMDPDRCRWLYRHAGGVLEVESTARTDRHVLHLRIRVLEGAAVRLLLTHHVALAGDDGAEASPVAYALNSGAIEVKAPPGSEVHQRFPEGRFVLAPDQGTPITAVLGDDVLFEDGQSRNLPFLCLRFDAVMQAGLEIRGELLPESPLPAEGPEAYWASATAGLSPTPETPASLERFLDILPWFAHNALIHFLAPRGLEQYSGGGWGTRDVTQGPVEYLLAIGRFAPIRALLERVFTNQNEAGDWPQWFMFYERERHIRPDDAHGDIVFWPVLATAQYLLASGDGAFLDQPLAYFNADTGSASLAPVQEHLDRALKLIRARVIPGTALESYGHGDWNDSLQPFDPSMRERLSSAWTVTLHYQTLRTLSKAYTAFGRGEAAKGLEVEAEAVLGDFRRLLLVDGVLTGYAHFEDDGTIDYLIHPKDQRTGLRYSILAMIHAIINGMFSKEEALRHLALIDEHLKGPDGAHLFDRPMAYRGGVMSVFQRAETASYFGREIGLMYTHAHLRYAEALWYLGEAEGFFDALSKVVPIRLEDWVPSARPRQANCYYSSSDAFFKDRYQAFQDYDQALSGACPLEGGWRVYSSGAGIATGLILRGLVGLTLTHESLIIDPVLPKSLNGMALTLTLGHANLEVSYQREAMGYGPSAVSLNGISLPLERLANPYREGGVSIPRAAFEATITRGPGPNRLEIVLG